MSRPFLSNVTYRHSLGVAVAVAAAAIGVGRAGATVVVAKDFAALCREADMIFVGTVTDVRSQWSSPDRQAIETLVTFDGLTWLRGSPTTTVTLRFAGGQVDGLREEIAGVPGFTVGERRVIFAHDGNFVSPIVGFSQGAFRVVDGVDGPQVVPPPDTDVAVMAGLRIATPAASDPARAIPLDEFLQRVRDRVAAGAAAHP